MCRSSDFRRIVLQGPAFVVHFDSADADYSRYKNATLLIPNRAAAEAATGITIDGPHSAQLAAEKLCRACAAQAVIVKLDSQGMLLFHADGHCRHFGTRAREVYDVTGAGDMVLAVVGLCLAEGAPLADAVELANIAAGLQVERLGVQPITRDELSRALPPLGRGAIVFGTRFAQCNIERHIAAKSRDDCVQHIKIPRNSRRSKNRAEHYWKGGPGGSLCLPTGSNNANDDQAVCGAKKGIEFENSLTHPGAGTDSKRIGPLGSPETNPKSESKLITADQGPVRKLVSQVGGWQCSSISAAGDRKQSSGSV